MRQRCFSISIIHACINHWWNLISPQNVVTPFRSAFSLPRWMCGALLTNDLPDNWCQLAIFTHFNRGWSLSVRRDADVEDALLDV
jgi:hypothetical protein